MNMTNCTGLKATARDTMSLIAVVWSTLAPPVLLCQSSPQASRSSSAVNAVYAPEMTFEVASVRESNPDPIKGFLVGGGFAGLTSFLSLSNDSISDMLARAYHVSSYQIRGLPEWTTRAMYDVRAKADGMAGEKLASLSKEQVTLEQQHMLQTLLAVRFNIKLHWGTQEGPVYNLLVVKSGSKMHKSGSLPPSPEELRSFGGLAVPEIYQRGDGGRGYEFVGHDCKIASLAEHLRMLMSADVIDKTGLTERYDFKLQYSQASEEELEKNPEKWPRVSEAVENQLGLKLEHAKGVIKTLVVDHIDKPSEN